MHKMKELTALCVSGSRVTTIAEAEVTDVTKTDRTQNSIYLHKQRFLLFCFLLICATIEIGKGKLPKARWVHMTKARLPRIYQDENSSIITTANHVRGKYGRWRIIQEGELGQHQCLRLHSLRQAARLEELHEMEEEHAWSLAPSGPQSPSILTTRRADETNAIEAFEAYQVSAFMEISFRIADSAKSVLGSTEGPKAAWRSPREMRWCEAARAAICPHDGASDYQLGWQCHYAHPPRL